MKTIIQIIATCAVCVNLLAAAGIESSSEISVENLGWKKYIPGVEAVTPEGLAWIVTCKITDGDRILNHRSYGYYDYAQAVKAFLLLINPESIGGDFKGTVARFVGSSTRLPDFHPDLETIFIGGDEQSNQMTALIADVSTKIKITYMVETITRRSLEQTTGTPQYQKLNGNKVEHILIRVQPPHDPLTQDNTTHPANIQPSINAAEQAAPSNR